MAEQPPAGVRAAFGVAAAPVRRLPSGGSCWQADGVVLKPGQDPVAASWLAEVSADLSGPDFRVPRPVRAAGGAWVVDGWAAWTAVAGEPAPVEHWPRLIEVSRAFHAAVAGIPLPAWVARRRDRWAVADRAVWEAAEVEVAPELADLVAALRAVTRPVRRPEQFVHGDLAGNVLFAAGYRPAVIDLSPIWRPPGYALAIAAVDVLTWSGAAPSILDALADEDDLDQLLVRALTWRLVTESLGRPDARGRQEVRRAHLPVVDLVLSRAHGRHPGG